MTGTGRAVKVRMLFFGPLAERLGEREIEVALEQGTTAEQLITGLNSRNTLIRGSEWLSTVI